MMPVLLHTCCAPCSASVIEWLLINNYQPTLYFFNPNIFPKNEYEIRKNELLRYAQTLKLSAVDDDYNHTHWLVQIAGYEREPERGQRCAICFKIRMMATATQAHKLAIPTFATTLASSRWKNIEQINTAGTAAAERFENMSFLAKNWRTNGLADRRAQLLKENKFYNQQYCGCEFSVRKEKTV
ncbi:MAG: epoxyqueuosine reductase QueH [Prevotellaceae bacterium]|jgi:predicted adenine nucleotide alpha hydrolase (AANH) superfamily ATPase|nr:epoxyqueuosine reductase QueH [Prevotellaceae bacterium]